MNTLNELREAILGQLPPEARFTAADAAVIARNKTLLLLWEEEFIKRHYNALYGHPATAKVLREEERSNLENLLSAWWRRLVNGPIDDQFWNWMTYVGLKHVQRKVKNPMMIGAWGYLADNIITGIHREEQAGRLEKDEARLLSLAFVRFGKSFTSLVAESYLTGLAEATGTNLTLLETLASQEVGLILEEHRNEL